MGSSVDISAGLISSYVERVTTHPVPIDEALKNAIHDHMEEIVARSHLGSLQKDWVKWRFDEELAQALQHENATVCLRDALKRITDEVPKLMDGGQEVSYSSDTQHIMVETLKKCLFQARDRLIPEQERGI